MIVICHEEDGDLCMDSARGSRSMHSLIAAASSFEDIGEKQLHDGSHDRWTANQAVDSPLILFELLKQSRRVKRTRTQP